MVGLSAELRSECGLGPFRQSGYEQISGWIRTCKGRVLASKQEADKQSSKSAGLGRTFGPHNLYPQKTRGEDRQDGFLRAYNPFSFVTKNPNCVSPIC